LQVKNKYKNIATPGGISRGFFIQILDKIQARKKP